MSTFDLYSEYYDLLYHDKDYGGETDYVLSLIHKMRPGARTLLDLGCGTGRHIALLKAAGYDVCGVDASDTMLKKAKEWHPQIPFHLGDARNIRLDRKFDVVTSLFHVASYQTSNSDFIEYLATVKAHMAPGSIFIFDFWYGPGVLTDPPVARVKRLQNEKMKILRIAEPTLRSDRNVVDVHYQILVNPLDREQPREIHEDHRMRYFFQPELEHFLQQAGLTMRQTRRWMTDDAPDNHSWTACAVASIS